MEATCLIQRVPLVCTPVFLPRAAGCHFHPFYLPVFLNVPLPLIVWMMKHAIMMLNPGHTTKNSFLPNLKLMSMWSDYNHSNEVLLWELDKDEYKTQNQGM